MKVELWGETPEQIALIARTATELYTMKEAEEARREAASEAKYQALVAARNEKAVAAEVDVEAAAAPDVIASPVAQAEAAEVVSESDFISRFRAYVTANGAVEALAVLEKYGAKKVTDVSETDRAKLLAEVGA